MEPSKIDEEKLWGASRISWTCHTPQSIAVGTISLESIELINTLTLNLAHKSFSIPLYCWPVPICA